jgi:phosphopantetheine adenylyltransferase
LRAFIEFVKTEDDLRFCLALYERYKELKKYRDEFAKSNKFIIQTQDSFGVVEISRADALVLAREHFDKELKEVSNELQTRGLDPSATSKPNEAGS